MVKRNNDSNRSNNHFDLDSICAELGAFGPYQRTVYFFICIAIVIYAQGTLSYVFTAGDLNYRCYIPDKDTTQPQNVSESTSSSTIAFLPPWLSDHVPFEQGSNYPKKCRRYAWAKNDTDAPVEIGCDGAFIYETQEQNLLNEFSLQCSENDWKRTIIGSVYGAALFVGQLLIGLLSDRFGRKPVFIWGFFGCGVSGLLKSISSSYPMYLIFEFCQAAFGSGIFMGGFVLGMEFVGPSQRNMGSQIMMSGYTIGIVLLGAYASWTSNFRYMLWLCYAPALFVLSYFWIIPESFRWLMISGRRREATEIIMHAAKVNGVALREDTVQRLHDHCNEIETIDLDAEMQSSETSRTESIFDSKVMMLRTLGCCFCWFVNAFVHYGLTLNSVSLAGSKYTNFILINAVEIPANIGTYFLTEHVGRRWSLCGTMLLAGCSCLGTLLVPTGDLAIHLLFFLLGKFAITASYCILYIYTAEIFPTGMRNGMMSTCSMIGRLGSISAPQTPLLESYMHSLPMMLYSGCAIFSGLMVLQFPETFNTKLPDTIEEAINIGTSKQSRQGASKGSNLI